MATTSDAAGYRTVNVGADAHEFHECVVRIMNPLVEVASPSASFIKITLPTIYPSFRVQNWKDVLWFQVVPAIRSEPEGTASYSRILDLLGARGDAMSARHIRRALSDLFLGNLPEAPLVERASRGVYRRVE